MSLGYHGDIRIPRRGAEILAGMVSHRSVVVRTFAANRADEVATHRFFGSPAVTPEAILSDMARLTARACRGRRIVAAQDTTEINFSGADRKRRGLGLAGDGKSLGFFIHPVVAVDADDEVLLGVVGARIWTRGMEKVGPRQKRLLEEKESHRWLEGARTAARVLSDASVIVVGDRESDIYEVFAGKTQDVDLQKVDLVVRARANRRIVGGGMLYETGDAFAPVCEMDVKVAPRGPGDKGRIARVAVAFGRVSVARPKTLRADQAPKQLDLTLIVARECEATASKTPLLWRLLTTMAVTTADEARDAIGFYRLRWRIEQVFRVLKTDGLALEKSQICEASRLFNLAAMALGAAARIIQLTDARDGGPRPTSDILDDQWIDPAKDIGASLEGKTARQKNPHAMGSLPWLAWIVARLGGWHCYYKPPGPKTMAQGMRRLMDMLQGYEIAKCKSLS